jgi:hypothetical protein
MLLPLYLRPELRVFTGGFIVTMVPTIACPVPRDRDENIVDFGTRIPDGG